MKAFWHDFVPAHQGLTMVSATAKAAESDRLPLHVVQSGP